MKVVSTCIQVQGPHCWQVFEHIFPKFFADWVSRCDACKAPKQKTAQNETYNWGFRKCLRLLHRNACSKWQWQNHKQACWEPLGQTNSCCFKRKIQQGECVVIICHVVLRPGKNESKAGPCQQSNSQKVHSPIEQTVLLMKTSFLWGGSCQYGSEASARTVAPDAGAMPSWNNRGLTALFKLPTAATRMVHLVPLSDLREKTYILKRNVWMHWQAQNKWMSLFHLHVLCKHVRSKRLLW